MYGYGLRVAGYEQVDLEDCCWQFFCGFSVNQLGGWGGYGGLLNPSKLLSDFDQSQLS